MEFLKVVAPDEEDRDIDVLINGERNGKVGEILMLDEGFVMVSIDLPSAEEKEVDLCDTTPTHTKTVEIRA